MNRKSILLTILLCVASWAMASPVTGLLERIDKGASKKFIIEHALIIGFPEVRCRLL